MLRSFRSAALLSQEALAERSGVSARTVSDIETGSARTPRLITVMLLTEAMKLSVADRSRFQEAAGKRETRAAGRGLSPASALHPVPLIGRDADIEALCTLLSRDGVRFITLVGPAGVGKTSLATNVAIERASTLELGATMVELAPIVDPSLVPIAVARSLGRHSVHVPRYAEPGECEAELTKVRETLGAERFDVQWRIGTAMTLERALEEARDARDQSFAGGKGL